MWGVCVSTLPPRPRGEQGTGSPATGAARRLPRGRQGRYSGGLPPARPHRPLPAHARPPRRRRGHVTGEGGEGTGARRCVSVGPGRRRRGEGEDRSIMASMQVRSLRRSRGSVGARGRGPNGGGGPEPGGAVPPGGCVVVRSGERCGRSNRRGSG